MINIISPSFVDEIFYVNTMVLNKHNFISKIDIQKGGCARLKLFKGVKFNWLDHNFKKIYKENNLHIVNPKIFICKNQKTTFVKYSRKDIFLRRCKLPNIHIMYPEYYKFVGKKPLGCFISVDFASTSQIKLKNVLQIAKFSNLIFCSDHDDWATDDNISKLSKICAVIYHTPNQISIAINSKNILIQNKHYQEIFTNKKIVGLGDLLAYKILYNYDKIFEGKMISKKIISQIQKEIIGVLK